MKRGAQRTSYTSMIDHWSILATPSNAAEWVCGLKNSHNWFLVRWTNPQVRPEGNLSVIVRFLNVNSWQKDSSLMNELNLGCVLFVSSLLFWKTSNEKGWGFSFDVFHVLQVAGKAFFKKWKSTDEWTRSGLCPFCFPFYRPRVAVAGLDLTLSVTQSVNKTQMSHLEA